MAASSLLQTCRDLHAEILRRMTGASVQSASGGGRSVSYRETKLGDLVALYRSYRRQLTDAERAGLPDVDLSPRAGDASPPRYMRGRPSV